MPRSKSTALRRINKEWSEIQMEDENEEFKTFSAHPIDEENMYLWVATIKGPEGSPYEGGIFYLNIEFLKDFPYKPPKVNFVNILNLIDPF